MQDFESFYYNDIFPILNESGILEEWKKDYNKYNYFYTNMENYFYIFNIFCILLFILFWIFLWNFEDWSLCHPIIYYSIGVMSVFGLPAAWLLSLATKCFFDKQKKEKEKYYKNKMKTLGVYKKILQNLYCEGNYYNIPFPQEQLNKSKLLKQLGKIVLVDDCVVGNTDDIQFSIYDCVCLYYPIFIYNSFYITSYNTHNLIVVCKNIFKNNYNIPKMLITKDTLHEINDNRILRILSSLFLKYPNNTIIIEIQKDQILICLNKEKDYFEFCDLSNSDMFDYENFAMLSGEIKNILEIIKIISEI